jgi:hypothetical protein
VDRHERLLANPASRQLFKLRRCPSFSAEDDWPKSASPQENLGKEAGRRIKVNDWIWLVFQRIDPGPSITAQKSRYEGICTLHWGDGLLSAALRPF